MLCQQGEDDSVADHIKNVKNLCQVLEHYGGWFIDDTKLIEAAKKKDIDEGAKVKSDKEYRKAVRNKSAELRVLKSTRHKAVLRDIRKKYLYKEDVYPANLTKAQELLNHHVLSNRLADGKPSTRKPKEEEAKTHHHQRRPIPAER